jgi:hypothetical protein
MNIPHVIWEGEKLELSHLNAIIEAIKSLFGRKGRIVFIAGD